MNGQEKVHVSYSATILVFMVVYKMRSRGGNFWLSSYSRKKLLSTRPNVDRSILKEMVRFRKPVKFIFLDHRKPEATKAVSVHQSIGLIWKISFQILWQNVLKTLLTVYQWKIPNLWRMKRWNS